jgi:hypothetical protein
MTVPEKEKQLVIIVSDKINIHENVGRTLQSVLTRTEKKLWAILVVIVLNLFSPFLGFCLPIWPTIIITWVINAIGFCVGFRAITKLKEIRISESG